jgi:aspartyl-tRNA synthetase
MHMRRIFAKETIRSIGKDVFIAGWINTVRSHGKLLFIDLRDRSGIVQVVFGDTADPETMKNAKELRPEWVVGIGGEVRERPKGTKNPDLPTGDIEIAAKSLTVFSKAKTLPFAVDGAGYDISEEKRLRYRYLDLRRSRLQKNLTMRDRVIREMRDFLGREGFIEIETPILTKSTPEGARDFLVPSRIQPGKFYALPQSPQQYKQLLQVAGFERYFQIARCFRDEDARADRQAEFTQLDIEMSFVEQEDILDLIERLYTNLVKKLFPEKTITIAPFPRLTYREVMEQYGTDKPDLRDNKNDPDELAFAFIIDFPMFEWRKEEKRWDAVHHPFTRPQTEDIAEIKKNPATILAFQYDFVLNGYEIGGGSLRSYKPEVLEAVFEVMGHRKSEIQEKFGHLLEAFSYGVPPHGGIAPGIDRFLAVVFNEPSIREVIAFPKTGDNRELMMGAPSEVSEEQLKELHLKIRNPNPK